MGGVATVLAGGAIGSAITLIVGLGVRTSMVPSEIAADDRLAKERDCDLGQWVADEDLALKRRLGVVRAEPAGREALHSGEYAHQVGLAKEASLHAYRDQQRQAERDVARIFDREGWLHVCWRSLRGLPRYTLSAPTRVEPVLDKWRLPATRHLSASDVPQRIEDPTRRTLQDTLDKLGTDTDAFQ